MCVPEPEGDADAVDGGIAITELAVRPVPIRDRYTIGQAQLCARHEVRLGTKVGHVVGRDDGSAFDDKQAAAEIDLNRQQPRKHRISRCRLCDDAADD